MHLDIRVFSKRLYYETLAVHDSDFVLLYPPSAVNITS